MSKINVIEYEEQQKKAHLKRYLKDKEFAFETAIAISNITAAIVFDNIFSKLWFTFLEALRIANFKRINQKVLAEEKQELEELLRDSKTYKELESEYSKYIEDLAKFIRIFKLGNVKETIIFIQFLMENGVLCINNNHTYRIFKNEREYTPELLGAKVVTGTCVCRHMSSFFTNMLNILEYPSINIGCHMEDNNPIEIIKKGKVPLDHCVVGTYEEGSKIIYDPTHNLFATIPTGIDMTKKESKYIAEYITPLGVHKEKSYLIMSPYTEIVNKNDNSICELLYNSQLSRITPEEFEYIINRTRRIFESNIPMVFQFIHDHLKQTKTIASLYKELMPYSDEDIRKHLIRK